MTKTVTHLGAFLLLALLQWSCGSSGDPTPRPPKDEQLTDDEQAEVDAIVESISQSTCDALYACFDAEDLLAQYDSHAHCLEEMRFSTEYQSTSYDVLTPACAKSLQKYYDCELALGCDDMFMTGACEEHEAAMNDLCYGEEDTSDPWEDEEPTDPAEIHPGYPILVTVADQQCSNTARCFPETMETLYSDHEDCVERRLETMLIELVDPYDEEKEVVGTACAEAVLALERCIIDLPCEEQEVWWDTPCTQLLDAKERYCAVY